MSLNPKSDLIVKGGITVGIPAYNGVAHIRECLESLARQTRRASEVLVFDDCSQDNTLAVAGDFAAQHPALNIRVERNAQNLGMAGNWSQIVSQARGEFVKILHQDDFLAPDCLKEQAGVLEYLPNVEAVTSPWLLINSRGRRILRMTPLVPGKSQKGADVIRLAFATLGNPIGQPTAVMFRTRTGRQVGAFRGDMHYYLDIEYWLRLLNRGDLYCCRSPLYNYRIHGTSATASINKLTNKLREERHLFASCAPAYGLAAPSTNAPSLRMRLWVRDVGRGIVFRWAGFR